MKKYNYDKDKVCAAVAKSTTYTEVLEYLGIPSRGGNNATIKRVIDGIGLDVSHFMGRRANTVYHKDIPLDEYINGGKKIKSAHLLAKLIKAGVKQRKCESCGIVDWNSKPIVLHLHHCDGNPDNNSLDNLQVLCPNCHSQTDNFKGLANSKPKKQYFCKYCGKEVKTKACCCIICANEHKSKGKYVPISKEQLESDLISLNYNMSAVGRKYGLSDNAIRKKCHKYGIDF